MSRLPHETLSQTSAASVVDKKKLAEKKFVPAVSHESWDHRSVTYRAL